MTTRALSATPCDVRMPHKVVVLGVVTLRTAGMERKMDRRTFSVVLFDEHDDVEKGYWRGNSPHERLQAVEETRQMILGNDPASTRLQRVLEVAFRPSGGIEQPLFIGRTVNPTQV